MKMRRFFTGGRVFCGGVSAILVGSILTGCSSADLGEYEEVAEDQSEIAGGSTQFSDATFGTVPDAIGTIPGCTATLISDHAALTAAHCVCPEAAHGPNGDLSTCAKRKTFTFPDGLGSIAGDVKVHPAFGQAHWFAYDYAIINFDNSYRTVVSDSSVVPVPVADDTLSVGHSVYLVGYGSRGDDCEIGGDGQKRWISLPIATVTEDWDYRFSNETKHSCPGDSGGPALRSIGGKLKVVGVASWKDDSGTSIYKSSAPAFDWILENSGPKNLPQNTWGHCVYYPNQDQNDYYSTQSNASSFTGSYARFDNSTSQVWVKKGHEAVLYDAANYGTELVKLNGFIGSACNEDGCLHNLAGTSLDNRASSAKCQSALPTTTWGHCVYYDRFAGGYYSTQGNAASFSGEYASFNNRISDVWVKRGHRARVYAKPGYEDLRRTLLGTSGDFCNAYGCLHDLSGSTSDDVASSIQCVSE